MNETIGWVRGFFIALALPLGIPLATILLAFAIPAGGAGFRPAPELRRAHVAP
jgi:hypothetical protein